MYNATTHELIQKIENEEIEYHTRQSFAFSNSDNFIAVGCQKKVLIYDPIHCTTQ